MKFAGVFGVKLFAQTRCDRPARCPCKSAPVRCFYRGRCRPRCGSVPAFISFSSRLFSFASSSLFQITLQQQKATKTAAHTSSEPDKTPSTAHRRFLRRAATVPRAWSMRLKQVHGWARWRGSGSTRLVRARKSGPSADRRTARLRINLQAALGLHRARRHVGADLYSCKRPCRSQWFDHVNLHLQLAHVAPTIRRAHMKMLGTNSHDQHGPTSRSSRSPGGAASIAKATARQRQPAAAGLIPSSKISSPSTRFRSPRRKNSSAASR